MFSEIKWQIITYLSFKLSHNCVGYSVLGVLGTADIWMDDYKVMLVIDDHEDIKE